MTLVSWNPPGIGNQRDGRVTFGACRAIEQKCNHARGLSLRERLDLIDLLVPRMCMANQNRYFRVSLARSCVALAPALLHLLCWM